MAIYKLYPYKDATVYSFYPDSNTGLDSILEAGFPLTIQGLSGVFRFFLAFDQTEINNVFLNQVKTSTWQSNLRCYIANAEGMGFSSKVFVHPTSGSWNNGTGQFGDNPIVSDGISWNWRNYISGSGWEVSGYSPFVTASFLNNNKGGGVWYTGSSNTSLNFNPSQSFDIRSDKDLNINVTDIVKAWYSSSNSIGSDTYVSNNGFIVKFDDATEFLSLESVQPDLKFFSVDTHTIYPPELEIKWRDYSFAPGTSPIITDSQIYASVTENPGFFYPDSINRFRINCRPKYPTRVYQTSSINTNNYYLPSSSYYAIKDLDTNEYVIDFDTTYTQISADSTSNYFDIYMNGLQPERYYKILIQTVVNNNTIILDNDYYFKIING